MIKIIAHDTTMEIPIFNTIYGDNKKIIKSNKLNIKKLNYLDLQNVNYKRFPIVEIIKKLPNRDSLFETVIVSANDELVNLFLDKKIKYSDISKKLLYIINKKEFTKFKNILPTKISQVIKLNKYVRFKINTISV